MAIPRLTESANPFELTITVNTKLRPYFEVWYQQAKEAGETPEQFAIRIMKTAALNHHIQQNIKVERDAIEQAKIDAAKVVQADVESIASEVD